MGYERNNPNRDYQRRSQGQDYGRDYGAGDDYTYSSARSYAASGEDRDRDDRYGQREYGNSGYGERQRWSGGDRGGSDYGRGGDYSRANYGGYNYSGDTGRSDQGRSDYGRGGGDPHRGSYASDGNRFADRGESRDRDRGRGQGYGRQPQGYDYDDRGFIQRAGDEVRSWFGDEDAERRREADMRNDDRYYARQSNDRDDDYRSWRTTQVQALDRDYDEYRRENRSKFENEFSSWRTERQGQRSSLSKVSEHMEVVGSDGSHVGTVDKVRGDRILLTKNDSDAGGRHHSIPSRWITTVDDKVTLSKSADEAKKHWQDEDRNQAMFGYGDGGSDNDRDRTDLGRDSQGRMLNNSFSGTY